MEAAFDVGSHDISDPSEAQAEHIPVKKLSIGTWNLLAKYDEHVLLSFYWAERKLVWEVLHLGVVRKMEVDFEDIAQITHSSGADEMQPEKLTIELHRPPRFFKENPPSAVSGGSQEVNYVYTTDFTNGQASTESRHVLLFDPGAITRETAKMLTGSGIRLVSEGAVMTSPPPRGHRAAGCCGARAACTRRARTSASRPRPRRALTPSFSRTSSSARCGSGRRATQASARYAILPRVCDPVHGETGRHTRARAPLLHSRLGTRCTTSRAPAPFLFLPSLSPFFAAGARANLRRGFRRVDRERDA